MASRTTWTLSHRETLRFPACASEEQVWVPVPPALCLQLAETVWPEEVPPLWASMSSAVKDKVWTRAPLRGPSGSNSL